MNISDPSVARGGADRRRHVLAYVQRELALARASADPWPHLERAHILSQPWAWPHTKVHAVMLRRALGQRDPREALGQVIRVIVAGPGSLVGKYPEGNSGRAAVKLTAVADVPADLEAILAGHE